MGQAPTPGSRDQEKVLHFSQTRLSAPPCPRSPQCLSQPHACRAVKTKGSGALANPLRRPP